MLEFFTLPFMMRALIAGIFLGLLLSSLGVFVTLRHLTFFGEGIAHASLAGIALALMTGLSPLPVAMVWAALVAVLIFLVERRTTLSSDIILGIFFIASMALGVILMSQIAGYQPDLITFLFGSILSLSTIDVWMIVCVSLLITGWLLSSRAELMYLCLCEEQASVSGVPVRRQTLLLYIGLAVASVIGVKMLGIILISALLILPAATSRLLTYGFYQHLLSSMLIAEIMIFIGLILSYLYDLPSGATIVLVGAFLFLCAFVMGRKKYDDH